MLDMWEDPGLNVGGSPAWEKTTKQAVSVLFSGTSQ